VGFNVEESIKKRKGNVGKACKKGVLKPGNLCVIGGREISVGDDGKLWALPYVQNSY
jgi:hypothetical protein